MGGSYGIPAFGSGGKRLRHFHLLNSYCDVRYHPLRNVVLSSVPFGISLDERVRAVVSEMISRRGKKEDGWMDR